MNSVAFSPDGKRIAGGLGFHRGNIKVWNIEKGYVERTCPSEDLVNCIAFHPTKHILASQEKRAPWATGSMILWDMQRKKEMNKTPNIDIGADAFCFSPDGTTLAVSFSGYMELWNVETGEEIQVDYFNERTGDVDAIAFSADGSMMAAGDDDHQIEIWDLQNKKKHLRLRADGMVFSVAFSPDGKSIVSGDDSGTIKLWNIMTGEVIHTFVGHSKRVNSVALSPDGTRIVSGSDDHTIKLWDVKTGEMLLSH